MSIYIELFLSFLQVGMFSIGGGYAALNPSSQLSANAYCIGISNSAKHSASNFFIVLLLKYGKVI